jgi:hypothetical protein
MFLNISKNSYIASNSSIPLDVLSQFFLHIDYVTKFILYARFLSYLWHSSIVRISAMAIFAAYQVACNFTIVNSNDCGYFKINENFWEDLVCLLSMHKPFI